MTTPHRTPPLGATVGPDGTHFGVWAPRAERIDVQIDGGPSAQLIRDADGVHVGLVPGVETGARYKFRIDGGDAFPDPRSRFQPDGVHGPSEVIDPGAFAWTDADWPGITMDRLVVYELHVGTYTPEGTFLALIDQLPEIKRLGVTAIELMPVADFPGRWNWGYDGVAPFAPSRAYGRPGDLRQLVDAAHRNGLAVLLDVVYNHLGPDGNYLGVYSADYFTDRHQTPWGNGINYDGANSRFVRDFVIDNGIQWVRDFHFDGLRLDATDTIRDDSELHIMAEFQEKVRAGTDRNIVLIAEESRNTVRTIQPVAQGGLGYDAVWADDFHHSLRVHLTGTREHYYADYEGSVAEITTAINEGFVYQGQRSPRSNRPRGTKVTDEPATGFIVCIQNHDQVGNRPFGERVHHDISMDRYAVASSLLLFLPEPPLLFMGQEFAASTPFLFFTDHNEELGKLVTNGRRQEFSGFRAFSDPILLNSIPDPQDLLTFLSSRLKLNERDRNAGIYALYRDLLELRRTDSVLRSPSRDRTEAKELGAQILS
ncbi:MAG TPA: malto-oligosyltrehalose trehalohydrolase, partial [Thermomicrobiales bacterium]|nr:malto-oligosyltrehalose trehalohydrolase [Thermomicrobiales bacterium]